MVHSRLKIALPVEAWPSGARLRQRGQRIFQAKQRSYDKPCGMFSSWQMFQDLSTVGSRERELPSGRPLRKGIQYDAICDILARHFSVDPRQLG